MKPANPPGKTDGIRTDASIRSGWIVPTALASPMTKAGEALVERAYREHWMYSALYPAVDLPAEVAAIEAQAAQESLEHMAPVIEAARQLATGHFHDEDERSFAFDDLRDALRQLDAKR